MLTAGTFRLTLTDRDGVLLSQWLIGGDNGEAYPFPFHGFGASALIEEISEEISRARMRAGIV